MFQTSQNYNSRKKVNQIENHSQTKVVKRDADQLVCSIFYTSVFCTIFLSKIFKSKIKKRTKESKKKDKCESFF